MLLWYSICQTFSTSLLWVDHWTGIIFLNFQKFGSSPVNPFITRMFLVKFTTFLCRFQRINSKTSQEIFEKCFVLLPFWFFENLLWWMDLQGMIQTSENSKIWFQSSDLLIIKKYWKFGKLNIIRARTLRYNYLVFHIFQCLLIIRL